MKADIKYGNTEFNHIIYIYIYSGSVYGLVVESNL